MPCHGLGPAPAVAAGCVARNAAGLASCCAGKGLSARVRSTTSPFASAVPCTTGNKA